ncbi:MAG: biotin/lipoyl-containing protein [Pirellulales bacterium]
MPTQIKLPSLGENIESGDVLSILVSEGDTVKKDQDLLELETDKATMPIPSPRGGKITKILVSEGQTVKVGAPIIEIEAADAEEKPAKKKPDEPKEEQAKAEPRKAKSPEAEKRAEPEPEEPEPEEVEERAKEADVLAGDVELAEEPKPGKAHAKKSKRQAEPEEEEPEKQPAVATKTRPPRAAPAGVTEEEVPGDGRASAAAGPAVRRLARQLGVDLRRVRPTGTGGRITTEDLRAYVRETNEQVTATMPRGVTPPGAPDTDDFGAVRI